jgi:hypothetical protein
MQPKIMQQDLKIPLIVNPLWMKGYVSLKISLNPFSLEVDEGSLFKTAISLKILDT